ncbi:MAG: hypothetical protein ACI87O_001004 [Planctomycetota bacterium]|jgi:hypothetical protein
MAASGAWPAIANRIKARSRGAQDWNPRGSLPKPEENPDGSFPMGGMASAVGEGWGRAPTQYLPGVVSQACDPSGSALERTCKNWRRGVSLGRQCFQELTSQPARRLGSGALMEAWMGRHQVICARRYRCESPPTLSGNAVPMHRRVISRWANYQALRGTLCPLIGSKRPRNAQMHGGYRAIWDRKTDSP